MTEEICHKIEQYAIDIDRIVDKREYGELKSVLCEIKEFMDSDSEADKDPALNYYLGTGYSYYSHFLEQSCGDIKSIIGYRQLSMFCFRRGLSLYGMTSYDGRNMDSELYLRMLTNYANVLSEAGRVFEALRIYRLILKYDDHFKIARANYGRELRNLSGMVNDEGHFRKLSCYAYQALNAAIGNDNSDMDESAVNSIKELVKKYEKQFGEGYLEKKIIYEKYTLGDCQEEIEYRTWCLNNHLFLNPMNEVIELENAFAHDPLTISTYTEDIEATDSISKNPGEPPRWFAMLNQLKEEYIYARYLCFAGMKKSKDVHFADRDVNLSLASYDHTCYSIRLEQIKSSFRILYSMLDQISFFVNDFWKLGIQERSADTNHILKASNYPFDNKVLVSLYWVHCEFHEKYGDAKVVSENDIKVLRNALEHKFVKIHEGGWDRELQIESDSFYHVSEDDLKKHTLRLLEICREALMYLVYAIDIEESKKEKTDNSISMYLTDYMDEWKR